MPASAYSQARVRILAQGANYLVGGFSKDFGVQLFQLFTGSGDVSDNRAGVFDTC